MSRRVITDVPEQTRERFPELREKWRAIGLSTADTNKEAAAAEIAKIYTNAGDKVPEHFVYVYSPSAGAMAAEWLDMFPTPEMEWVVLEFGRTIPYYVFMWLIKGAPFDWRNILAYFDVDAELPGLAAALDGDYSALVVNPADGKDHAAFVADEGGIYATPFYHDFWNERGLGSGRETPEERFDKFWHDACVDQLGNMAAGPHDATWLAYYDMWANDPTIREMYPEVQGEISPVLPHIEYAKHAGWWQPFVDLVIIQRRPSQIHLNAQQELHNPNGLAVEYKDGSGIGMWTNIPINANLLMYPPTAEEILGQTNSEIMRILIEKWVMTGVVNILEPGSHYNPTLVNKDATGELWHLSNIPNMPDGEGIHILHVENGTPQLDEHGREIGKYYYIPVPIYNDLRPDPNSGWARKGMRFETAHEAVAYTYYRLPEDYPIDTPRS